MPSLEPLLLDGQLPASLGIFSDQDLPSAPDREPPPSRASDVTVYYDADETFVCLPQLSLF
jgi:hypothetical protein